MEKFGEYLKAQREKKSIRLEEIASITKIHLHSLELLEANQWDQLPPEPFIRGFIIAYAKYVGLDAKETLAKYLSEVGQTPLQSSHVVEPSPSSAQESPNEVIQNAWQLPINKILVGGGIAAVITLAIIFISVGKKNSPETIAEDTTTENSLVTPGTAETTTPSVGTPPTEVAKNVGDDSRAVAATAKTSEPVKTADTPVQTITPPLAPPPAVSNPDKIVMKASPLSGGEVTSEPKGEHTPPATAQAPKDKKKETKEAKTPSPHADTAAVAATEPATTSEASGEEFKHHVEVEGQDRTWIKIVVDEKPPVEYFLPKGEKASYKAKNKIKVVLGNSSGSKVVHNGEVNKGVKFQGTIRSYIFPPNARFPQDIPSKRTTTSSKAPSESGDAESLAPTAESTDL